MVKTVPRYLFNMEGKEMRILNNLFLSLLVVFLISAIGYQFHTLRVEAAQEAKGAGISTWSTNDGSGGMISSDTVIFTGANVIYSVVANNAGAWTSTGWSIKIHDATSSGTAADTNLVIELVADDGDSTTLVWESQRGILVTTGIYIDVTTAECTIIREEPAFRPIY